MQPNVNQISFFKLWIQTLIYQRFTPSSFKAIGIIKLEFMAKDNSLGYGGWFSLSRWTLGPLSFLYLVILFWYEKLTEGMEGVGGQ